jgi:hypothetical protein
MTRLRGCKRILPRTRSLLFVSICAALLLALSPSTGNAFERWWVQAHTETQLWSGPDEQAISFGGLAQWSYLQVVAPQSGPRLHVFNPSTDNYAYVDAAAVGPSSAPPPSTPVAGPSPVSPAPGVPAASQPGTLRTPPALAPNHEPWWVSNFLETALWAGPAADSPSLGLMPQFRRLMVLQPQHGTRIRVWNPEMNSVGYVDAAAVGPSGPSVWLTAQLPRPLRQVDMTGRSVGDRTYLRLLPIIDDETAAQRIPHNSPVQVQEVVLGSDGAEWYRVGEGLYMPANQVRLPRVVPGPVAGKWIHVDLAEPAMMTAYEGGRIVYTALAIKGVASFATPKGVFQIFRRVENEIMDSETLIPPIPRMAPGGYYLKNVLYTQYFTGGGASFHYNYWSSVFGYPGSHGCLGLTLEDSRWLWDWAEMGTTVVIE